MIPLHSSNAHAYMRMVKFLMQGDISCLFQPHDLTMPEVAILLPVSAEECISKSTLIQIEPK